MKRTAIVEPYLTEVAAGFYVLFYLHSKFTGEDELLGGRLFRDKWEAEAAAHDWEQGDNTLVNQIIDERTHPLIRQLLVEGA